MPKYEGLNVAVITVSDRAHAGTYEDLTGPLIAQRFSDFGATIMQQVIVPDDVKAITDEIKHGLIADVIITTGGTGVAPRDVTPEATRPFITTELPGIPEALRSHGAQSNPMAVIGRGLAGFHDKTLIVNLPGALRAVEEGMDILLPLIPHLIGQRAGGDPHSLG